MPDIDHIDVEFPGDQSLVDHFDVDQPDQESLTTEILEPPGQVTIKPAGTDVVIKSFVIESVGPPGPQGPQGIPGPPGQGFYVIGESPSGALDGVNTIYTTTGNFMENSLSVFLNGLRLQQFVDYVVPMVNGFQMNYPPLGGDTLVVDYVVQS